MSPARRIGSLRGLRRFVASSIGSVLIALAGVAPASAVGDFQLLVTPADQLLPPGGSVSFLVQVGSIGGFADEVTLTVGDLPAGVTSQLSDDTVTPPASVHLTLIASEDAEVGSFPIVVTGMGGGITHQATGSVTVDFGLVPICYARIEGTVTDRETGLPIAGANVFTFDVFTDAQGHYSHDKVGLGENNAPSTFPVLASAPGYWSEFSDPADFVCDQTTTVDFTLLRMVGASAHGTVVEGTVDPNDPTLVIPGNTPIQGIQVGFEVFQIPGSGPDTTDAAGTYQISLEHLGGDNTPIGLFLQAHEGVNFRDEVYWPRTGHTPSPIPIGDVSPGDDVAVPPIGMVRKCFGSVSGTLVYGDTQQPAAGVTVTASHFWYNASDTTDANGVYDIPVIALGYNNQPTDVGLTAFDASGFYFTAEGATHFDACGDQKVVALTLPPVFFGSLQGRVTDVETDQPLPGAQVAFRFVSCPTCDPYPGVADANGDYRISRIPAPAAPAQAGYSVEANYPGYWWEIDGLEISAGEVATRNFALLRQKFAAVRGTVTDAITGQPIEGAGGGATHHQFGTFTDAQGHYSQSDLLIGYRNAPLDGAVSFGATGYWPAQVPATFEANTESVVDLELIPICEGATIRGRVVDATNQQPLEGATVFVLGNGQDFTDANGRYEITDIQVGTNNSPISAQVFAFKEGYFSQSKTITVFCGASIFIDFGRKPPHLGALEGFVTNAVTGDPIPNLKIVGAFGLETMTDGDGHYLFEEVPVNDDGSPKDWDVSALPTDFPHQTKSVTVRADETARLDFQFGGVEPPPTGNIVVKVVTQPAGSSQPFSFTSSYGSPFSLTDGQSNDSGPLDAGETYSVTQTPVTGWDTTASCDQGQTPSSIALAAGVTVTCTFVNRQLATLIVRKTTDPSPDPTQTSFSFTAGGGLTPTTFSLADGGSRTFANVVPGTGYTVSEDALAGWLPATATCNDGSPVTNIDLAPGETVTCTFVNKRVPLATGAHTIGFWRNKNGQSIITSGAVVGGACASGTWLRQFAPFQDLPASSSCSQVAAWVTKVINAASSSGSSMNPMLKAQTLATALSVYFSDPALGGNRIGAPAAVGQIRIDLKTVCILATNGSCGGQYEDVSPAFGGAASLTVADALAYAASQSNSGGSTWYGNVKATQALAKDLFDAINNNQAFGPP